MGPQKEENLASLLAKALELRGNVDIWRAYCALEQEYHAQLGAIHHEFVHGGAKVLWWCWLQGLPAAPDLCKVCLESLVRHMPEDWQIYVVTEENYRRFITLPEVIEKKYRQGKISKAHFTDILRTELLVRHGGVWVDATVYCSRDAGTFLASYPLFLYSQIARGCPGIPASNWLISSIPHHPILETVRDLLHIFWQEKDAAPNYFFYHFFLNMAIGKYPELWHLVPRYSNIPSHLLQWEMLEPYNEQRMQQLLAMASFHKLTYRIPASIPQEQLQASFLGKLLQRKRVWQLEG